MSTRPKDVRASFYVAFESMRGMQMPYADNVTLAQVGFDSIDLLEAITIMEQHLGVRLELSDFADVQTFGDLIATMDKLINHDSSATLEA